MISSGLAPGSRFFLDRLLVRVMVPVLLGVLVTTLLTYFHTRRTVEGLVQGQVTQALGYLDREVGIRAREMRLLVHLMSQDEVLRLALEDSYLGRSAKLAAQNKIEGYVRNGAFERVYLISAKGKLVLATDPTLVQTLNIADRSYFRKALAGQQVLETYPASRVTGLPFVAVSAPLRGPDGAVQGVVVGIMHTGLFARLMLNETRIGTSGGAYFLDSQGLVLASPTWAVAGHFSPGPQMTAEILASAEGADFHRYAHGGRNRVWLARRNEATGWMLVMETDEAEMLAPATRLATVSGGVSFLVLALVAVALGMLRRVMASLRKSEANSRAVAELSPVGIVTFDAAGRPYYLNAQARNILDLDHEAPPPADLRLEDESGAPLTGEASPVKTVLERQEPLIGLLTWYRPAGGWRKTLYFNATPLAGQDGEASGAVATLEDITERMQALELLHQSEKRFSSLFRLSPDSILLTEVDSGVIVDVNESFVLTAGYSRDEAIGRTVHELGLYADMEQGREINERLRRDGFVQNAEVRGRASDGREAVYSLSSQVIDIGESKYSMTVVRDITERMLAEAALRQSEERFSSLFRLSPDSILLTEMDTGRIVDVNKTFTDTFGPTREEALGRTAQELGLYVDEEQRQEINERVKLHGQVLNAEVRGRTAGGGEAMFSLSSQVVQIGDGAYRMTVVRDITERTQAMEQLRQSEERFSKLFRLSPEAILLIDSGTGKIVDANEAFLRLTGYALGEALGRDTLEMDLYVRPEQRAELYELHKTQGHVDNYEFEGRRKDGSLFFCATSGLNVSIGQKKYLLVLMNDITERKRAEDALRKNETFLATLLESIPVPVFYKDAQGRYTGCNSALELLLGLEKSQLIGKSVFDLHPRELAEIYHARDAELFGRVGVQRYEASMMTRRNGLREVIFHKASYTDQEGNILGLVGAILDITERKRAEENLADSERRFRTIFENAPYAIAINRVSDGKYVDLNRAFLEGAGVSRSQALGMTTRDLVPMPELQEKSMMQAIVDAGGTRNSEIAFTRQDGSVSSLIYSSVPLVVGGEPCLLTMTVDISDRKRAEEALRQSNRALTAFKEFSASMLGAQDESAFITDICRILVEVCGYRMAWVGMAEQGPERHVRQVGQWGEGGLELKAFTVTWGDSSTGSGAVGTAIKTRQAVVARDIDSDSRFDPWRSFFDAQRYRSMIALPLVHGGLCLGALSIYAHEAEAFDAGETELLSRLAGDVTFGILSLRRREDHKRAEEHLRQSEEKFSRLFLLSPDAIVLVRMADRTLAEINDAYVQLFGYSREEALGRNTLDLNLYADARVRDELFAAIARDGQVENFEVECRRKDGSPLICSMSCHILHIGGEPYMMSVLRNITETKKMQEMMIQTEKMISVGGIAAGIAHEINNPLGIVLQAAQNLVQRSRPDFPKNIEAAEKLGLKMEVFEAYLKARKLDVFIQDIQSAAVRASAIIRHMLDFSRKSESRRKVCSLPEIVDRAVDLAGSDYDLKKSYDFKRIKITRDYPDELPPVSCTETEIEQVLLNLLRNAAQALAAAEPPVQEPCIDIVLGESEGFLSVRISDNGPGMGPDVQRRIFEPFFTTKPPGVGTGLGLSVSYFIITKGHKGRMSVRSQPGAGTEFLVELPAVNAAEEA